MAILGALPCLHGGGKNTTVQPVFISDLAKAISMVAKEEACRAQTFEFVGFVIIANFTSYSHLN